MFIVFTFHVDAILKLTFQVDVSNCFATRWVQQLLLCNLCSRVRPSILPVVFCLGLCFSSPLWCPPGPTTHTLVPHPPGCTFVLASLPPPHTHTPPPHLALHLRLLCPVCCLLCAFGRCDYSVPALALSSCACACVCVLSPPSLRLPG